MQQFISSDRYQYLRESFVKCITNINFGKTFITMQQLSLKEMHLHLLCWILTHCGRVTHICVGNLAIIGSDNGLSPGRCQAIIWTNAGLLLIGPLGTNFCEILSEIFTFSFKKINLKMSSGKWRPFCHGVGRVLLAAGYSFVMDRLHIWEWCHKVP